MHEMLHNAFGVLDDGGSEFDDVDLSSGDHDNSGGGDENVNSGNREILNDEANTFYNLLKDAEQELYPSCKKFTNLSFIVRLFHIKCHYGLSDNSIIVLLELFKEALPEDTHNVRLGLASDGFNPFGTMSISHSTWLVVLMIYNLPHWMCMKQLNFIMSLLIPGSNAPRNDIDVYLQPLKDELNELCDNGLRTFDASTNQKFNMRASLLWTVSDFLAYANLSGWSTKESIEEYGKLKAQIAITLCHLERIFPPSCFDIMVHLLIHLTNGAKVARPVHYRWMYPIERSYGNRLTCYYLYKAESLYDMDEVANIGDLLMENESYNTANLQQFMDNEDDFRDNVPEIMLNSTVNIVDVGAENSDSDDDDVDEYHN
ncbi:hypothetical protein Dsin_032365 [Dipteronia sinensis]|uniref:DUF4218 domain-containing protein n=1 Tax=Dipteronia sinensis TaxID=43782 RepID=A0AAD9ZPJ6_9ROSI|nr:hypothetical protein Dsin_032365 [Dipteronia sinensis]